MEAADTKVPLSAAWLGGLGALPFIGLAGAMPFITGAPRLFVARALLAYGATILSFLGGVHWGLAIRSPGSIDNGQLKGRLIVSVVPSLAAWIALLIGNTTGLLVLAIAVAAMLVVDLRASRLGPAPPWYAKLRIPLTCIVVTTLVIGATF